TIEYKALGVITHGQSTHISFETKDGIIDFIYNEDQITLQHGNSKLHFSYHQEVWNQYELPYGSVPLKTKLITFEANEERIKMKYELYDQGGLISTAYILMTLLPHLFQEVV
ncbi:MAG: DUF1934 family protein, partial [Coprobacillus sp.]